MPMKRKTRQSREGYERHDPLFFRFMEERIHSFANKGKYKTARNCLCALKHLYAYCQGKDLPIKDLSPGLIADFQDYLVRKGLKLNTVSLYLRMLRAAYNQAVEENIVSEDRHPFHKAFTGLEKTRKRAVSRVTVKRMITARLNDPHLDFARDLFLFSFYMQGMPFVDIAHLKKTQMADKCIVYRRSKTHRTLKVRIDPQAQRIIDKYRTVNPESPYIFPILQAEGSPDGYDSALRVYNKRLHRIAKLIGLDEPLTSYVSRHTWASLARAQGISDTVICEAMGHNNVATTAIYLASLDTNVIASANRKLIASLMRWRL